MKITRYDLIDWSIMGITLLSFQYLLIPLLNKISLVVGMIGVTLGGIGLFFFLITMVDSKSWIQKDQTVKESKND